MLFFQTGPHLFQTEPSGVYFEYKAQAIGARSQSARTYLEKTYASFQGRRTEHIRCSEQKAGDGFEGLSDLHSLTCLPDRLSFV